METWQRLVNFLGPEWTWVVIVGIIIFGILFYIAIRYESRKKKKRAEKRAESLKEFGPQVPFHSLPNEDLISKFADSTGLMRHGCGDGVSGCFFGVGAMNLMEGNMGSIDFVSYDYEYETGGGWGTWRRLQQNLSGHSNFPSVRSTGPPIFQAGQVWS